MLTLVLIQLLGYILPPKLLGEYMGDTSPFPLLRLILPEMDTSRPHNGMKEKTIARSWAEAMGFARESRPYQKLLLFNDPTVAGPTAAGDLSIAVKEVMENRIFTNNGTIGSTVTVGTINELLDGLSNIKTSTGQINASQGRSAHDWRESQVQGSSHSEGLVREKSRGGSVTKQDKRTKWVQRLIGKQLSVSFQFLSTFI